MGEGTLKDGSLIRITSFFAVLRQFECRLVQDLRIQESLRLIQLDSPLIPFAYSCQPS